ncbi:Zn-dependent exopeptidase [Lentinus tigrinus ALCF2SS1-6]|uniref:Peptide hydrolase n=1 Tax=Lentinus tigrinus ALCF2SS1-6 TaxID=1328759 RepID=A0A5C2SHL3_9APHY|nr:Zn-dependent exopeptidase [Lentinus tigrinus ALCF2SS1-6]
MVLRGPLTLLLVPLLGLDHVPSSYDCLFRSYYGTYSSRHAFLVDEACWLSSFSFTELGTAVDVQWAQNLVWVGRNPMDSSLVPTSFELDLGDLLTRLANLPGSGPDVDSEETVSFWQTHFKLEPTQKIVPRFDVLHLEQTGALLSVDNWTLQSFEAVLPCYWAFSVFPTSPLPLIPVSRRVRERLRDLLPTIRYNHVIAALVNGISVYHLREDIQYLTGEDPSSDILSRHSFSEGAIRAAEWLKVRLEESGASCALEHFQEGFSPNVICEFGASGNSTETVIVGAHYDDRGSFGSVRAPGANDDGSGTGALLAIARAIARRGVVFRKTVRLCAFSGEEQSMVGSRAYAAKLRARGEDVLLMVQGDMLAFHAAGEPPQLGLSNPALVGTAEVTQILANVSAIYGPELTVGYAPYPGGSDHQSFHEQGYPSAQVYERAGYIKDPMYHDSGDLSEREGYDFEQIKSIAKVQVWFDLSGDHNESDHP